MHRPVNLAPAQTLRADENHRPPGAGACGGLTPPAARKDICGARCRTPPSAPAAHPPPLAGEALWAAADPKAPLQGELAAKPTEGCIAALRRECPAKSGRALPQAAQGAVLRNRHPPAMPALLAPPHENPCSRSRPPQKNPPPCAGYGMAGERAARKHGRGRQGVPQGGRRYSAMPPFFRLRRSALSRKSS